MKRTLLAALALIGSISANAQIVNATEISVGADAIISSDMDFLNTASGKLGNEGTMMLKKNIVNDGTMSPTGRLILNGDAAQRVSGKKTLQTGTIEFSNAGTTLNTPVRVNEAAVFNTGIVQADEAFPVIFAENARVTNASDVSHVDGHVTIEKAREFTFPIGDGSQLKAFTVDKAENFTANYKAVSPMYISKDRSENVENMNENEYWVLKSNGRSAATNVSVKNNDGDATIVSLSKGTWDVADENAVKSSDKLSSHLPLTSTEQLFTIGKGRKNQAGISVYPNPTHGEFALQFSGIDDNENVKVSIALASGISIMSLEGKASDLKKTYKMPEDLASQGLILRMTRTKKNQNFVERIVYDK